MTAITRRRAKFIDASRINRCLCLAVLPLSLAACQSYAPVPLPQSTDYAQLAGEAPEELLSLAEVASWAVQHNPDLVTARAEKDVAQAQAFQAGLLPDPQFTASLEHPTSAATVNGYALGLSEELQALLTRPARHAAALASADQAKLNLLWEEWQTIEQATSLAVQKALNEQKAAMLLEQSQILLAQSARSQRALERGNRTVESAGTDLAGALDTTTRQNAAARDALANDVALKRLLNLAPEAMLTIAELPQPPEISHDEVEKALINVAKTRPDLLALKAGYQAQEENVRTAILQQFPAVTLGFEKGEDVEGAHNLGFSVAVNLPLFGNTQAVIRTQEASRTGLRAEYQARLDSTTADAWHVWREIQLLKKQIALLNDKLPALQQMAAVSAKAYANGDLAPATYILLQTQLQAQKSDLIDLQAARWTDTIALSLLLAKPLF